MLRRISFNGFLVTLLANANPNIVNTSILDVSVTLNLPFIPRWFSTDVMKTESTDNRSPWFTFTQDTIGRMFFEAATVDYAENYSSLTDRRMSILAIDEDEDGLPDNRLTELDLIATTFAVWTETSENRMGDWIARADSYVGFNYAVLMDYRPADILGNPEHWNFHTATQKVEEYSNTEFAISQYYENPAEYKNDLEAALSSAHANLLATDPQYAAIWNIVGQEADKYQDWGFDPTRGATGRISSNTQLVPGGADFTPTQLVAARERSETIAANPPAGVRAQVTIPWADSNGHAYVTTIRYYDWGSPNTQPEPTK